MSGALLEVRGLGVHFGAFPALQDVSFDLSQGETLGLVGESGSGKSTLARAILRLIPVSSGSVFLQGENLLSLANADLRRRRRDLQIVFQDPLASLNPRMSVGDALAEPLKIYEPSLSLPAREARIADMLERVGLAAGMVQRYPHEFSGGQCQRIGIARAMMLRPKLLVCDEPVSSLDMSIQGQIVNLLVDLQQDLGTAMLFISHNLAVVRHLSHRVLVIYRGKLVELAARDELFATPAHPYTRALLAAIPDPAGPPQAAARRVARKQVAPKRAAALSAGAPPGALETADEPPAVPWATGCAFHERCAYAQDACLLNVPPLQEIASQHFAACHRWREVVYS